MRKHIWYYLVFITVELSCLFAVMSVSSDLILKRAIVCFMAVFYIVWAILHHWLHHSLSKKIVIEYVLIGLLGVVVVLFFIG
ncbi:MAG TPA: hypothetical protein VLF20_05685 [Patescibacteria group bacterium]|nr:hypothetical protein [Patescibacteria group bacterium]